MKNITRFAIFTTILLTMQSHRSVVAADEKKGERQAAIHSTGEGPYYRLNLPVAIYQTAAHVDLRDVRVHNANGELVPHAWLQNESTTQEITSRLVDFFPITSTAGRNTKDTPSDLNDLSLEFKQNADGSLLRVRTKISADKRATKTDSIIDVSQIKGNLLQARFEVDENAEGLFPFSLDASDDLRHWYTISNEEQIAILKRPNGKIERLTSELYGKRAKFLRLRWHDAAATINIKSITIDSVIQNDVAAPLQWSTIIKSARCAENYCDYLLPANTPIDSLRINLNEANTLASIMVLGQLPPRGAEQYHYHRNPLHILRHKTRPQNDPASTLVWLAQAVSYRLTQGDGEIRSENLAMDGGIYTHLRIQTEGEIGMLGKVAPSIQVGTMPRSLIFLGRGSAPYSLTWGAEVKQASALPLATLIPGYQPKQALAASDAIVDIPFKLSPTINAAQEPIALVHQEQTTKPEKKLWLWAALVVGLVLLGGMAWSLFKSMGKPE